MHALSALVGVFGASIWDISQNHGATCRLVYSLAVASLHIVGLHV
ncbi:MAG TPA: hypothetical protein VHA70_05570 [Bauldia sp.]|nr:hypothetical protein [Bauldia sp.]HVZ15282.1 hypothetical protein [Bauldia sp.]